MPKISAGLLMYRKRDERLEMFLGHPGGPFWSRKDAGAWSIPKGEVNQDEEYIEAAKREFQEETGIVPKGEFLALGSVKLKSGKIIHAWAFEGDSDPQLIKSATFEMEWPPHSGQKKEFPEIDRAEFFKMEEAKQKINPAQIEFLNKLNELIQNS